MSKAVFKSYNSNAQVESDNVVVSLENGTEKNIMENGTYQVKNASDSFVDFTLHQGESHNYYNINLTDIESSNKKIISHMELSQIQNEKACNDYNSMSPTSTSQMFQTQEKRKRGRPRKYPRIETIRSEEQVKVISNSQAQTPGEPLSESHSETVIKSSPDATNSIMKGRKSMTPRYKKRQVSKVKYMKENEDEIANTSLDTECKLEVTNSIVKGHETNRLDVMEKSQIQIVKCIQCQKEVQVNQWSTHNLSKHNSMGWYEGQEPLDFENDLKLLRRTLTVALKRKKGQLSCEKCGVIKRSVNGFISHMQFCGKTDDERKALMATCSVCNAIMMPSSLEVHERQHREVKTHRRKNTVVESPEQAERVKRKAAEKAISKILQFTELVKDEVSEQSKNVDTEPFVLKNIKMPELKKRIPAIWKNAWKKELNAKGTTMCRQLGCKFSCSSYDEMCKHSSECNFIPQENYICKVCKFSNESKETIFEHIKEQHSTEDNADNYSDSKQDTDSSTDAIDDDSSSNKFKQHMQYEKPKSHNYLYLDDRFSQRMSWNIPYTPALQWTMEFELENYQLELFNEYLPNTFELLSNQDSEQYLPKLETSMPMKILNVSVVTPKDKDETKWKSWNRFEGAVVKGCSAFFTGGPVWALAWLPIPAGMYNQNVDQYIAVSTHPNMESEYAIGRAYSHSNLIQIWNVGKICNEIKATLSTPVLSYAIAHNNGTIWCLEWCPSGCYQHENMNNYEKKKNQLKRMGLLAAGCSNGSIYVYSLPFPDEFISTDKMKSTLPIYKTEPTLILVVNNIMYHNNSQNWQCTKLSWTKERGHNTIAAGFSNGYIALWNLSENSPLLVQKQKNTRIINAFMHFYAHSSAVSMVALIPYGGERFLASASTDRCYKFWDLENVSTPQECVKKGIITDGSWMTHWPAAIISFDDSLGYKHTNSYIIPLREHGFKYVPILATNSSTYSISVSDHANSVVHGTLAGEILSIFPHQLLYSKDIDKVLPKKRQLNSFIEVVDFKTNESNSKETKEKPKEEKKKSKEYRYMPETYDECKDRFGIIFYNNLTRSRNAEAKDVPYKSLQADRLTAAPIERYPFTSVNKIAWNPNIWSYLWLATGYQNGLIRLLSFQFMSAGQTTKLIEGHAKRFTNRSKP